MGLSKFKQKLKAIAKQAKLGIGRENVRVFLLAQYKRSFLTRGATQGPRWAGYEGEPKYASLKRAVGGGTSILRWDGSDRLFKALTKRGDSHQVWRASRSKAEFGARLPYADRLTRGGRGPFGERFPGRQYLTLGPRTRQRLAELLRKDVQGKAHPSEWRR